MTEVEIPRWLIDKTLQELEGVPLDEALAFKAIRAAYMAGYVEGLQDSATAEATPSSDDE